MAYNNPYFQNPYYLPPHMTNLQNQAPQQMQGTAQMSFVGVQNEQEARLYPVGPGNSITFRDESGPFIYTKVMGNSPLDRPIFEKYRLVKEDATLTAEETPEKKEALDPSVYALKEDIVPIKEQLAAILKDVSTLKEKAKKKIVREVEVDDD